VEERKEACGCFSWLGQNRAGGMPACPVTVRCAPGECLSSPAIRQQAKAPADRADLRKAAARNLDDLWRTVGTALPQFTPAECANIFTAAGYEPE
jgi:hypothetical protein